MASEQSVFEEISEKLGEILSEGEETLDVALAVRGPRLLTFFLSGGPSGRWLVFASPWVTIIALLTGLVTHWLLVVTPSRLVAMRVRLFRSFRPAGEANSFHLRESDINVTNSFVSGWIVEAKGSTENVKYSVLTPAGSAKKNLQFPEDWTFDDFTQSLLDSWEQARK